MKVPIQYYTMGKILLTTAYKLGELQTKAENVSKQQTQKSYLAHTSFSQLSSVNKRKGLLNMRIITVYLCTLLVTDPLIFSRCHFII